MQDVEIRKGENIVLRQLSDLNELLVMGRRSLLGSVLAVDIYITNKYFIQTENLSLIFHVKYIESILVV